ERDAVQSTQRGRSPQRVDLPLRRDPAHDRQMIARLPLADDRRSALRAIGLHDPRQEVESRFVHANKGPPLAPGLLLQRGPRLESPALDGLLIALEGPGDGDLGCPVKSLEDARHLTAAIPDAEFLPEDAGDPITSPDLAREAISLGAMPEEIGDQADRLGSEFGAPAGTWASQEVPALPRARGGQPLTDGPLGDAQSDGDLALLPTLGAEVEALAAR